MQQLTKEQQQQRWDEIQAVLHAYIDSKISMTDYVEAMKGINLKYGMPEMNP